MAHVVIAEACIHCHTSPFGICGGQSDSVTVLQVSLFGIIPPALPTHSFISHQFCLGFRQSLD